MAARQDHPYLERLKTVFTDADQDFLLEQCYEFNEKPIEDLIMDISEVNYPKNETQQIMIDHAPGPSNRQHTHTPVQLHLPQVGNKGVKVSIKIETINIDSDDESDSDVIVLPCESSNIKHEDFLRFYRSLAEKITIEDFLKMYPDPSAHFDVFTCQNKLHASLRLAYLRARYSILTDWEIDLYVRDYKTLKQVCEELDNIDSWIYPFERDCVSDYLINDIYFPFLHEMFYVENYELIRRAQKTVENNISKVENFECPICCEDNFKLEDMIMCDNDHMHCSDCTRKSIENAIGEGKINFVCFELGCEAELSMDVVKIVLDEGLYSKLVNRRVVEDVRSANLEGLESCPFCDYMAINPESANRWFHCANPQCRKQSCIKCKKEWHHPWPCEKDKQTKIRTEIENKMTEALVRTCYKCKKNFVKVDGCNKMVCSCGAIMCYLCRQPIQGYCHYYKKTAMGEFVPNNCPLFTKDEEYMGAVRQAGEKAKTELMMQNPDVTLNHDPTVSLNHR